MNKYTKISIVALCLFLAGCDVSTPPPVSDSGVSKASARVSTGSDGLTTEQRNVKERVEEDNKPGAIKHLYLISPMSGDVILYSTVRGKVTSGGKRLTPSTVAASDGQYVGGLHEGFITSFGGQQKATGEVLQDDGTYGSSNPYIFWWDTRGIYHQHFIGSAEIHISSEPMNFPKIILNLEKL